MGSTGSNWRFLDAIFVRCTGFPFSLIGKFRFEKTYALFPRLWDCEEKIAELAGAFRNGIPRPVYACVEKRIPIAPEKVAVAENDPLAVLIAKWNGALAELAGAREETRAAFESELAEKRAILRGMVERFTLFREAMFLSSNGASEIAAASYLRSDPASRNKKARQQERFFISYLQRLCAKNDTASYFGPRNFGEFHRENRENLKLQTGAASDGKPISRNQVFFSHWACYALSRVMSGDPGIFPFVIPRRTPLYRFSSGGVDYFGIEKTELSPLESRIVTMADGRKSFKEISQTLGDASDEEFRAASASLAEKKIITDYVLISPFSTSGVSDLLRFLSGLPEGEARNEWRWRLNRLEEMRLRFQSAAFEERLRVQAEAEPFFEETAKRTAKRGEGDFYTDRSIFFEECLGAVKQLEVGGGLFSALKDGLGPIMDALGLVAAAEWECWQFVGKEILRRLGGEGMRVPLERFWNEFGEVYEETAGGARHQAMQAAITAAKNSFQKAAAQGGVVDHESLLADMTKALKEAGLLASPRPPLCGSPDVLIAGRSPQSINEGNYTIYLGEIHPHLFTLTYTNALFFAPYREKHAEQLKSALQSLAGESKLVHLVTLRLNKLLPSPLSFEPLFLQEPEPENPDGLSIYDLDVTEREGRVVLDDRKSGGEVIFASNYISSIQENPDFDFIKVFSFPHINPIKISFQRHTPRIVWNGIVYQRESWRVGRDELAPMLEPSGFELFWNAYAMRRRLDLPDSIFMRHPAELKPFFIDFRNYFLLELFQHVVKADPQATLTEFAPDESGLWMSVEGENYCCELRAGMTAG